MIFYQPAPLGPLRPLDLRSAYGTFLPYCERSRDRHRCDDRCTRAGRRTADGVDRPGRPREPPPSVESDPSLSCARCSSLIRSPVYTGTRVRQEHIMALSRFIRALVRRCGRNNANRRQCRVRRCRCSKERQWTLNRLYSDFRTAAIGQRNAIC